MRSYDFIFDNIQDSLDFITAINEAIAMQIEHKHKKKLLKMKKRHDIENRHNPKMQLE